MTKTERKLQQIKDAEKLRKRQAREVKLERQVSQVSGFVMSFAEVLDTLLPGRICTGIAKAFCHRRWQRRLQEERAAA